MAISMGAALLGSAVIGGASSILGGSAQSKAANNAADASNAAAQLQYQLGQQSLQQNRDIYNNNVGVLSPFVSRGNVAGDSINALLGLPSAPASPLAGTAMGSGTVPAPGVQTNPVFSQTPVSTGSAALTRSLNPLNVFADGPYLGTGLSPAQRAAQMGGEPMGLPTAGPQANGDHIATSGGFGVAPVGDRLSGIASPGAGTGVGTGTGAGTGAGAGTMPTPAVTPTSATSALNNFANSAGMQFQLEQGANALNNLYAAHGALQSGAAMKAMQGFGQQTALNNYFLPYMGLLGGQQAVGAQAGSAIAGVGSNFGSTVANINNAMGNAAANNAANLGNIYMAKGANQANMFSNLGSSFGLGLGAMSGGFGGGSPGGIVFTGGNYGRGGF